MKVYHQTGHNYNWNIESFNENIGDGLIFSPVNIPAKKLLALDPKIKNVSFLDPQLYLLNQSKGKIETHPYFPRNFKLDFSTVDLDDNSKTLARFCVDYQMKNDFEYLVIPTKYNTDNPKNYLLKNTDYFVLPFCDYVKEIKTNKKILISVIVKAIMLSDEEQRNDVLNWITGHQSVDGVYLIFENNFSSKQIKDFDFLLNALKFIQVLKDNQMEVHIGYCNTEALIYSIAMPDSITIGSYENLRSFGIKRFQATTDKKQMRSPNARLYSTKLLQWVDYKYIQIMKSENFANYMNYFDDSKYTPLNFVPEIDWQFKRTEPYKHYFYVFNNQVKNLPSLRDDRINDLYGTVENAINLFKEIGEKVYLDDDSDGSHLPIWLNVMKAFQKIN